MALYIEQSLVKDKYLLLALGFNCKLAGKLE